VDAVSIATPSFLHHDHVLDAVDSRADPDVIWCEKPIAVSVSAAHEMLAACEDAGVDLVIDHKRRFSETYRALRAAIIEAEALGDVQSVHVQSPEELFRNGTHVLLEERFERVMGHLTDGGLDDAGGGGVLITEHVEAPLPEPVDGFDSSEEMIVAGAANVVGPFVSHYTGSAVDLPLEGPLRDVASRSQ
jgi:hypothetical protein